MLYHGGTALGSPSGAQRKMWSQSRHDPPEGLKAADLVAKQCRWGEVAGSVLQDGAGHY
ncbi:MAG: hypothetical protein IKH11_03565 [Bacteroidales bacterium]|nr:hypothetical protein [Bacteroidales bacterium]